MSTAQEEQYPSDSVRIRFQPFEDVGYDRHRMLTLYNSQLKVVSRNEKNPLIAEMVAFNNTATLLNNEGVAKEIEFVVVGIGTLQHFDPKPMELDVYIRKTQSPINEPMFKLKAVGETEVNFVKDLDPRGVYTAIISQTARGGAKIYSKPVFIESKQFDSIDVYAEIMGIKTYTIADAKKLTSTKKDKFTSFFVCVKGYVSGVETVSKGKDTQNTRFTLMDTSEIATVFNPKVEMPIAGFEVYAQEKQAGDLSDGDFCTVFGSIGLTKAGVTKLNSFFIHTISNNQPQGFEDR